MSFLRWLGYALVRLALCKYKVTVVGEDALASFKRGIVVGLGHVAYNDPMIVKTQLAKHGIYARPVAYSKMYDALRWVMQLVKAFRIESLQDGASDWTAIKIKKTVADIKSAVASGDTILIYASGQTKTGLREELGGKSSVWEIVRDCPDTPVLLVNIYGLYGSRWSRYFTNGARVPSMAHMWAIFKAHPWLYVKHLWFTRLPVTLECRQVTLPRAATPRELNRMLEDLYHEREDKVVPGREKLKIEYAYSSQSVEVDESELDPSVTEKVVSYLSKELSLDQSAISLGSRLENDLGMDSMGRVEMLLWIEENFERHVDENADITTVKDLIAAAQGFYGELDHKHDDDAPAAWHERDRSPPKFPNGSSTIPEAFMRQGADRGWREVAIADDRSGVLTYRELLQKATLLALHVRQYREDKIGMMLPASVGATIVALACMIAGKRLVPLNWTNGRGPLDQSIAISGVQTIFSSDAFLTKAAVPLSAASAERIVTLESLRSKLGLKELLLSKMLARVPSLVLKYFGNTAKADDVAVVLFTSGSEAAPKGVPLTHRNIMSNVDGALDAIGGQPNDVMLGFLPPFHSFGLTQIMMLGILGGVKTVYEPDPKKFKRLAYAVYKWKATLVAGTPDFLAGIMNAAKDHSHFSSMRAVLSGAQKAPEALKIRTRELGIVFLEGYGITETSPLITVTRQGEEAVGVGRPIKGVSVLIVDLQTKRPKCDGEEGLIVVNGPGVFGGYIGNVESPFVNIDGTNYYNTGDLGYFRSGQLVISGRLKRFRKYAGEMINLTMIEDILVSAFPAGDSGPRVAIEAGEDRPGEPPDITLYATDENITIESANKALKEKGLPRYAYVRTRMIVPEIPLLGSGKVNHRALPKPTSHSPVH